LGKHARDGGVQQATIAAAAGTKKVEEERKKRGSSELAVKKSIIVMIPDDVVVSQILSYLDYRDLVKFGQGSTSRMRDLSQHDFIKNR
jgi:hypothetical protein